MNTPEHLKLDHQLCFSLYAASKEVIRLYKPFLDELNITYTQYVVLLVLWEEEIISVKHLGKRLYLDSGTLTPLLKKLEAMELIIRYRTKEDDRIVNVELTEKGKELREKVIDLPQKIYCQFQLDVNELFHLKNTLDSVLKEIHKED